MKIDNLAVERTNTADTAMPRQGSRQVESVQQNRTTPSVQDDMKKRIREQAQEQSKDQESAMQELKEAIEQANKSFKPLNRRFEYSVHEALQRVSIKVIDSSNDKVIREIPSEKLLDMVANMLEVAGILVDERG